MPWHVELMRSEFPPCPFCESTKVLWIVYGTPTPEEENLLLVRKAILGGDFDNSEATLYCPMCKKAWLAPDYVLEHIAPPKTAVCRFCGSTLRPSERLRYEIDVEHFKELILSQPRNELPPQTLLQQEAFADTPYPICDKCRQGIHDNQRDRKDEEGSAANRFGTAVMRLAFLAIALYFATLCLMGLFRK